MGDCQNYGPFLGPYYNTGPILGDPERDHNFDNPPYDTDYPTVTEGGQYAQLTSSRTAAWRPLNRSSQTKGQL